MKKTSFRQGIWRGRGAAPVLALLLALQGCGLDKVSVPTDYVGPAALALDLQMQAIPDFVVADNVSESQINVTLRGSDGAPLAGRGILFRITDELGNVASIGELRTTSGVNIASGSAATAATNASGVATVFLAAPASTDILSSTAVMVQARPISDDANAAVFRSVKVQIVPAEPRLFPPIAGNTAPTCNFVQQPNIGPLPGGAFPRGYQILFQSTATDAAPGFIARYEWDFGDETREVKPDVNHAWGQAGTYDVTHTVVDNGGLVSSCFVTVTIQ